MASNSREQIVPDLESTEIAATSTPEVPSARPISELSTAEEFSEERNRLDQLVQQNTITRQEQLDLLGELRDRERELSEAAYQARQFVGPPVKANVAVPELSNEIATPTTPEAPTVTQTAPRTLAPAIETPTPSQVTAAITPAPVAQSTQPTTPVVTTTTTQANNANVNNDISDIMSLLSYKLDAVIALLDTGVTIQDRILLESRS
jgi:hypothetical protein